MICKVPPSPNPCVILRFMSSLPVALIFCEASHFFCSSELLCTWRASHQRWGLCSASCPSLRSLGAEATGGPSLCQGLVVQRPSAPTCHGVTEALTLEVPRGVSSSFVPQRVTGSGVWGGKCLNGAQRVTLARPVPIAAVQGFSAGPL